MTELEIRDELKAKREKIESFDDLLNFLKDIKENYDCNPEKSKNMDDWYGACPRVIAQGALAVAWYFAREQGLTGFQAGFTMWEFIRDWEYRNNKTSLRIVDYDDMLYPQYEDKFQKTIPEHVWEAIRKEAARRIEEDSKGSRRAHPAVKAHWQSIVDGTIPFGYSIKKD